MHFGHMCVWLRAYQRVSTAWIDRQDPHRTEGPCDEQLIRNWLRDVFKARPEMPFHWNV